MKSNLNVFDEAVFHPFREVVDHYFDAFMKTTLAVIEVEHFPIEHRLSNEDIRDLRQMILEYVQKKSIEEVKVICKERSIEGCLCTNKQGESEMNIFTFCGGYSPKETERPPLPIARSVVDPPPPTNVKNPNPPKEKRRNKKQ